MTPDLETRVARQCETLVYRAARCTDLARWEELAALFALNGKLIRPSDPAHPVVGRSAIFDSLRARPPRTGRHLLTNVMVDIHSDAAAHVSSTVTLFLGDPVSAPVTVPVPVKKILIGHFEDDVALVDGHWEFVCRDGSMVLEYESPQ